MSNRYGLGYRAHNNNTPEWANPFRTGTMAHAEWRTGWLDARDIAAFHFMLLDLWVDGIDTHTFA